MSNAYEDGVFRSRPLRITRASSRVWGRMAEIKGAATIECDNRAGLVEEARINNAAGIFKAFTIKVQHNTHVSKDSRWPHRSHGR